MSLTKKSELKTVFLQVKHNCLWQELKAKAPDCEEVTVTNPTSGAVSVKHGYKFHTVSGRAVRVEKYDTLKQYDTRYFGFKLFLRDGNDDYSIDMPYQGQFLRRFLRVAPNFDWGKPLSISVFKGKKKGGGEELGVWFQQDGQTVKAFYNRENPNGMPEATQDPTTLEWDFRAQHRWLVDQFKENIIPAIYFAGRSLEELPTERQGSPIPTPESAQSATSETAEGDGWVPSDDDIPF